MYVIIWRGVGQVFLPLDPCKAFLGPVSYPVEIQAAGRAETCCCHSLLAAPPVGLFLTRSFARQCPGRCHTCQWLTPTQATSQSCIESSYITPWDCSYSTDSPVYCVSIAVPRPTKECIQFIWYRGWQPGKLCTCTGTSSKNKHGVCWPLLLQSCWERDREEQSMDGEAVTEAITGWPEVTEWSESMQMPHVSIQQVPNEVKNTIQSLNTGLQPLYSEYQGSPLNKLKLAFHKHLRKTK